jgi:general stress protein YciG
MTEKNGGKMTVEEAGRKGGEATSESHEREFYQDIGSKGGQSSGGNFANDREKASEAGRKGG